MASILVCDDQRSICEMLDISLRREGHRVETVNAGEADSLATYHLTTAGKHGSFSVKGAKSMAKDALNSTGKSLQKAAKKIG